MSLFVEQPQLEVGVGLSARMLWNVVWHIKPQSKKIIKKKTMIFHH